ncbi:unnamed protein product, partial [Allacma fusca]
CHINWKLPVPCARNTPSGVIVSIRHIFVHTMVD